MFVDRTFLESERLPRIVIVGAGPAALVLAGRLARNGVATLLLEGGDEFYSDESQDIYAGDVIGTDYYDLDTARLRHFGGSGNHWGGWSRPLDARDFETREDLDLLGWPIPHSEIQTYAAETFSLLGISQTQTVGVSGDLDEITFSFSDVMFGERYAPVVRTSDFIHVLLNASVTSVTAEAGRVSRVTVEGYDGFKTDIDADTVVLACGGIENARLLLWSNEVSPEPVVADAGSLGRYWMEHPLPLVGESFTKKHLSRIWDPKYEGFPRSKHETFFSLTSDAARRYGSLSARIRLGPSAGRSNFVKYATKIGGCIVAGPENLGGECLRTVKVEIEQQPRFDNHVALSVDKRDAFGVPRTELHFSLSELDYHTAKVAAELAGRHLVENDLGIMRVFPGVIEGREFSWDSHPYGYHHMGGTRMAAKASDGVVDGDLKVHGMSNAYVLGSSVFPRGGQANPTFTILQLAQRLADHLSRES